MEIRVYDVSVGGEVVRVVLCYDVDGFSPGVLCSLLTFCNTYHARYAMAASRRYDTYSLRVVSLGNFSDDFIYKSLSAVADMRGVSSINIGICN